MANQNAPFGLRPIRTLGGTNVNTSAYSIATDYTTAIYTGDVVERSGTGRNVTKAAATNVAVSYTHLDVYKRQILGNDAQVRV